MGFREDVVIRIRGTDEESRVDMRSSSRYGFHDIGSNASRIRGYLDGVEESIDVALEREERKPSDAEERRRRRRPSSSRLSHRAQSPKR